MKDAFTPEAWKKFKEIRRRYAELRKYGRQDIEQNAYWSMPAGTVISEIEFCFAAIDDLLAGRTVGGDPPEAADEDDENFGPPARARVWAGAASGGDER